MNRQDAIAIHVAHRNDLHVRGVLRAGLFGSVAIYAF
jgi:hypothetical protein